MGEAAKVEAENPDKMVPTFSAPSADVAEPRALCVNRMSPFEPARMVPETAPPALTMAAEDVILETMEATSVPVPENAMRTS